MASYRTLSRSNEPTEYSENKCASPFFDASRASCLEQILLAFRDIAEFDDIHQAAKRLDLVQQWIRDETAKAARDPIFELLLPA